ncbi:MAG: alpha/beta hydrolase, partial [Mycobacterium sp.]|nr:alpha/beta hydrolase [Mycobacterium sp.]
MSLATRELGFTRDVARELGMVLPRTVAGLNESTGWAPASPRGVRQFGEVMLDELVLSGFSLLGGTPAAVRALSACDAAAEELAALGVGCAHADPEPLRVQTIRSRRIGRLKYERMTF